MSVGRAQRSLATWGIYGNTRSLDDMKYDASIQILQAKELLGNRGDLAL